jgi:6-phosphogluconolactonase (cycloisomerase 2 family)
MISSSLRRPFSRRQLLQSAAALAVVQSVPGAAYGSAGILHADRILAYVGTYTGAIGAGSNGEGIYLFEMNAHTGELTHRRLVAKTSNPSWIAIHPSRRFLYAVNEVADFNGNCGSVSAFAIVPETGDLRALNTVSSEGAGPAYLSIDATGTYAFVANYSGGSIAVLPILPDGSLGAAVEIRRDSGSSGNTQATNAPPGSFAVSGHDAPHAHMIAPDPQNGFVLATDLGQDRIYDYRFNAGTGKLLPPSGALFVALPSGDGPRHFAFHPNGHWFYAIQEEASNLVFFRYDPATGSLAAQQTVSTLPPGFAGSSFASEVLLSSNGRSLYAANRLHDTIAVFAIDGDGSLKFIGETSTMGDYPVQCRIDPTGNFFYACNRRSDSITSFRIQADTGLLTFTGQYTPVGSPASITFLA